MQTKTRIVHHLPPTAEDILARLDALTTIGRDLSRETNLVRLLERILLAAKDMVHADGGTLYSLREGRLHFEALRNDTLGLAMGGTTGVPISLPPVSLVLEDGSPNHSNVVSHSALTGETVNIEDAYNAEHFDFSGTRAFDARTGYRSQAFLSVPMKSHDREVIGVLQLINPTIAQGRIVSFTVEDQRLVESLASQAGIVLTNRLLINQLETLFESLIGLINIALDEKSPYTGRHCERVPALTMMLAEAASRVEEGPLADFHPSEPELYQLKIAGLLHDCGKITTPVHVVDKATKLETILDGIHLVDTRFEVLFRDVEIAFLKGTIDAEERDRRVAGLEAERAKLRVANIGTEFLRDERVAEIKAIGQREWTTHDGECRPFLTDDEIENLTIRRGTLTQSEREVINHHISMTIRLLEALPWPRHLSNVPEFAGAHHERMDGKGYPRGLTRDQMSIPARILGIADVFEALTAADRPYKPGKTLAEALTILGHMKLEGHIDPDLFDVFIRERVYMQYACQFLRCDQVDTVDLSKIPGVPPDVISALQAPQAPPAP